MKRRTFLSLILCVATAAPLVHGQTSTSAGNGTLRIYLARHGESEANAGRTLAGWRDVALTDKGRQQARELADVLKGLPIDAVYSSTLSRSRVTAETAAGGRPVISLDMLKERNFGRFEGGPNDPPEFLRRQFLEDDALDGGETLARLLDRARLVLAQVQQEHPKGNVLIVGHQGTNRMLLRALLGLSTAQANAITQDNDEVYAIDLTDGQPPRLWKLIREKNLADL